MSSNRDRRHTIRVCATAADIDELDHVSNLVFVRWVLEAARAHSAACGLDPPAYRALGAVFVVRRHELDYVRPALLGDELDVTTWVESWKRVSCLRRAEVRRSGDGAVLASAATTWAFVDFARGRPTPIPDGVRAKF